MLFWSRTVICGGQLRMAAWWHCHTAAWKTLIYGGQLRTTAWWHCRVAAICDGSRLFHIRLLNETVWSWGFLVWRLLWLPLHLYLVWQGKPNTLTVFLAALPQLSQHCHQQNRAYHDSYNAPW